MLVGTRPRPSSAGEVEVQAPAGRPERGVKVPATSTAVLVMVVGSFGSCSREVAFSTLALAASLASATATLA